jgi:mannose-6-phosphate isomerase
MTVELARARAVPKPWGVTDLHPWSGVDNEGAAIGEIWYGRSDRTAPDSSLLIKLLFTSQPLSLQVHPDDAFARTMGMARGKSEAWCVLSATPDAKVGLGLKRPLNPQQLRKTIEDGSIADQVVWRAVSSGDVVFVPAGTIHAIGAGLVIAEVQQRSDATFRLFDYGRPRELHIDNAVAVATTGVADFQVPSKTLSSERILLGSNPYFTLEKINLPPDSAWRLDADRETWLLVLGGTAHANVFDLVVGDAMFAQSDHIDMRGGSTGLVALVARTQAGAAPNLLSRLDHQSGH